MVLGLSPERAIAFATLSLEEIQLLVLEPPGPFMAAMYDQLSSLCSVSCVLRGHTEHRSKKQGSGTQLACPPPPPGLPLTGRRAHTGLEVRPAWILILFPPLPS